MFLQQSNNALNAKKTLKLLEVFKKEDFVSDISFKYIDFLKWQLHL